MKLLWFISKLNGLIQILQLFVKKKSEIPLDSVYYGIQKTSHKLCI